jgi:hypothetical protein
VASERDLKKRAHQSHLSRRWLGSLSSMRPQRP